MSERDLNSLNAYQNSTEHTHSHSHNPSNTRAVRNRLARVIGHLHAVERMVSDERDCAEILVQLAAVRSALNNICKMILREHMDHCVVDAIRENDTASIEELNKAIDLLMK